MDIFVKCLLQFDKNITHTHTIGTVNVLTIFGVVNHMNLKFKFFPPRARRLLNKQTMKLGRQKHWYLLKVFQNNTTVVGYIYTHNIPIPQK